MVGHREEVRRQSGIAREPVPAVTASFETEAIMNCKIVYAAVFGLLLLGAQPAPAQPMRCSGEAKTCNATCVKNGGATVANCLAVCHVVQANCMKTGCWDNGTNRYCGLMKQ